MNVDQFYLILPSNSSMKYFPKNTTSSFITQLPHEIRLQGQWVVALTEIQLPRTFLHVRHDDSFENRIALMTTGAEENNEYPAYDGNDKNILTIKEGTDLLHKYKVPEDTGSIIYNLKDNLEDFFKTINKKEGEEALELIVDMWKKPIVQFFEPGLYINIEALVNNLNSVTEINKHIKFKYDKLKSSYVRIEKQCQKSCALPGQHFLVLSDKLSRILGFAPDNLLPIKSKEYTARHPPSLACALPDKLFVYCSICEPRVTGDVKAPILRTVSVETREYCFGTSQVNHFSSPNYIPVLNTGFSTIEIDIRDQLGLSIPFEFGTLTATLHFKRID